MAKLSEQQTKNKQKLQKMQWGKYVTKGNALTLMEYNPNSTLYKAYKNTSYCNEVLQTSENGNITRTYCKNRWCNICARIKTGKSINNYLPELEKLFQPVFVTLTLPTVTGEALPNRIEQMEKLWRLLYKKTSQAKYKKQHSDFIGIRKAECTIRPNGHYHYHFHIILNGWSQAEWLVGQWLKYNPEASDKAQDIRLANEFSFKELFKYAFKSAVKLDNKTTAKRYDIVFTALRNKRTYQAFGGITKIDDDFENEELIGAINTPLHNAILTWHKSDWYDKQTGEALVNEPIPQKVKNLTNYPDDVQAKQPIN